MLWLQRWGGAKARQKTPPLHDALSITTPDSQHNSPGGLFSHCAQPQGGKKANRQWDERQ